MKETCAEIVIQETLGIRRQDEPLTVGIPFPRGLVSEVSKFRVCDDEQGLLPVQSQSLARWPDNSLKWVLFDFQVSLESGAAKRLTLELIGDNTKPESDRIIAIADDNGKLSVDTGEAVFRIGKNPFRLFENVFIGGNDLLDRRSSRIVLRDDRGGEHEAVLRHLKWDVRGPLRSCLKAEGEFGSGADGPGAHFVARVTFYAHKSFVKIDFTLHNPRAARHPGGLWDLGDKGSLFFKDLSIELGLDGRVEEAEALCSLYEDPVPMDYQPYQRDIKNSIRNFRLPLEKTGSSHSTQLLVYQDSSGGENWQSRNHVNRNNEVKTSFRGYRVISGSETLDEGVRANPTIALRSRSAGMVASIRHFWQNFPSALEIDGHRLFIRLFPQYFNDDFELQGGEQKTQTVYISFQITGANGSESDLHWTQEPPVARAEPRWYVESGAIPYLVGRDDVEASFLEDLVSTAVVGENTFFHRREVIDEYGWRHFGDLYADHENALNDGPDPLISHYNNQYDCLYGMLVQFMRSGDGRWFLLADQLGAHVRDIDIYHTDSDRPEYNHGLLWHTEHYTDAQTATHRCYSVRHADQKDLANYGGGPALSHNYASGLMYHYFITGYSSSAESALELAEFVRENILVERILVRRIWIFLRKLISRLKKQGTQQLVQPNKVYNLDGPGRSSGNAISTLLDAFDLTSDKRYLESAEEIILLCVHPKDNIARRDLLDIENRWMYTIFFQAVGKYLDVKFQLEQMDSMREYACVCLLNYAGWMVKYERLYMESPEKLEYPNETWPAQELRKCDVLLFAHKYSSGDGVNCFLAKAEYFYHSAFKQFSEFGTTYLTRPLALLLQNAFMFWAYRGQKSDLQADNIEILIKHGHVTHRIVKGLSSLLRHYSPAKEIRFISDRFWPRN